MAHSPRDRQIGNDQAALAASPPTLVLLTAEFPYGSGETFLESEIEVLVERFARILVVPSRTKSEVRALPRNVELVTIDRLDRAAKRRKALMSAQALRVAAWMVRARADVMPYVRDRRTYAHFLAANIVKFRELGALIRGRGLRDALFYDYWFENATLALALLRRSGAIRTAVSRAHGFDLYDERWPGGAVPFREAKLYGLDAVFVVSEFGRQYLVERVPAAAEKISVARLGVRDPGLVYSPKSRQEPLVVSCGNLIEGKAVHLVPEVLAQMRRPVRWVHFGDGPERARVERAARRLNATVNWELRGQVANRDVLRFYEENHVSALLSLSVSEGLPVSMMEAQSYGIPVVARAVQGVPEIVNRSTGVLVSRDASPAKIVAALEEALTIGRFSPNDMRSFFLERFEAQTNYNRFADSLIALHQCV